MKLANLLAQYLYTHKRLDLPGIGTFTLNPSATTDNENSKNRSVTAEGVSFVSNPSVKGVPDLISFISEKTGKMKALATSDLESHLELVHQFLNISKPYTFEGIGTLVRTKHGEFEFTSGAIVTDKTKEPVERELHGVSKKDSTEAKYKALLSTPADKSVWKKPVVALLVLCGIGLAVWGGYSIATKNTEPEELVAASVQETVPFFDTTTKKPDTIVTAPKLVTDNYKLVLEVAKANRAFKRFNQLKQTNLSPVVQMETSDSVQYKLFVMLPPTTDTIRVIDSLTVFLGKKVYIEHQN